ncbi:hypothetical protein Val02_21030 [Virgisporangium aliadipatigenens]|uniref:Polyketide cyclase n=1 Tax=Virgisporangium aliadipatigenens TaxID=741659 RepID=A0A8J3YJ31_9ACTN|nr:hypothetical protein [Virgisporangium aliadipatigenens]GIJ45217.1 hypothetical protein Val02_21030 [Virgisporangium aliadipatigenens]
MARVEFDVSTTVPPERFIAALTDFSPSRADVWPNIDAAHLKVHSVGETTADVTEGSNLAGGVWERNRYDWSTPGTVRVETTESNTWKPGSFWLYNVTKTDSGSHVRVTVERNPASLKGRLIALLLSVGGPRPLKKATEEVARKLERSAA